MKMLVTSAALAALIVSPALAQSAKQAPPSGTAVFAAGDLIGYDPDPNVRLEMQRDSCVWNGA